MKSLRKAMALLLAMVMVLAMNVSVFAATTNTKKGEGNFTVKIAVDSTDTADHTYGAYQVFKGDLAETEGNKVLSNIEWGDNIDTGKTATLIGAINTALGTTLATDADAAKVAEAISGAALGFDDAKAQALAEAFNAALKGDAKATAAVTGGAKEASITGLNAGYYLVKDVKDVDNLGAETRYILQVVGNVNVTEKADVPTIEKKVKEKNDTTGAESEWQDAADYDIGDTIPYQITGTLPQRFEEFDTFKTYTITDTLSAGLTAPAANAITIKVGEKDVTGHFDINVTGKDKEVQTITITLKEGEDLKTWTDPALTKDSKFVVDYKATLNDAAVIGTPGNPNEVDLQFSNNPNAGGDGDFGTTPKDKVVVFTYEIKALKVGEDETTPLQGAGFTLYKKVPAGTEGAVDGYVQIGDEITGVTTFEFKGTDAGEYKLVETTVPAGYNKAEDITFAVVATYDTNAADPQLLSLTVDPDTAGFTFTTTKAEDNTHITTDGIATGKIVNHSGSTLPSTGGIGTTIFYIVGGIIVAGAAILLIAKRKVNG